MTTPPSLPQLTALPGPAALPALKAAVLEPPGRITEVIADAPRLEHDVRILESERRDLLAAFDAFTKRPAGHPAAEPGAAERLIAGLFDYRQRVADLLYQAYTVDLGGET